LLSERVRRYLWYKEKTYDAGGQAYICNISELFDYSAHFKQLAIHKISIGNG